jgi:hypothetical protein
VVKGSCRLNLCFFFSELGLFPGNFHVPCTAKALEGGKNCCFDPLKSIWDIVISWDL